MSSAAPLPVAILAGGLATRLGELTAQRPKALLEIAGHPFLHHQLNLLRGAGLRKIVLCVGHFGEMIRDRFGDGSAYGVELLYSFDGPTLLGTGGALKQAIQLLGPEFYVLYGDSYLPIDYLAIEEAHRRAVQPGLMTVYHNEGRLEPSNVEFRDGAIIRYDKINRTPEMRHIDYGLGILSVSAFHGFRDGLKFDLAEVYQNLIQHQALAGYEVKDRFYEIGSRSGIADLTEYLKSGPVS